MTDLLRAKISTYQMYVLMLSGGLVGLLSLLFLADPDQLRLQTIFSVEATTLLALLAGIVNCLILLCLG